jgi:DTW domain-containing protein YfiP
VQSVPDTAPGRPTCYRCHKPQVTCICARVPRVENRTGVWILQHPRERAHPIGTARIARLGLGNVHFEVCYRPRDIPPAELPAGVALLYPGPGVPTLESLAPAERPSSLVVLDGTWANARNVLRDNAWLKALPRVGLEPARPSRYRLRKEPALECLSTIEAIVEALSVIEPDTPGLGGLLAAFDAMIDDQIAIIARERSGKRVPTRPRRTARGVPRAFFDDVARLVVIYGEAARAPARDADRVLVQWAAVRPASGEVLDAVLRPDAAHPPNERHLHHMRLDEDALGSGVSLPELAERWRGFASERDIIVAWNKSTHDLLQLITPQPRPGTQPSILLKTIYCTLRGRRCGALEEVVAREGLSTPDLGVRGRAGLRLGNALALLGWMQRSS